MLKSSARLLSRSIFALALVIFSLSALAIEIPKSLEEWKPWVLEKHPELNCPIAHNSNSRTCSWLSELHIDANSTGAKFSQRVETFKDDWVSLPGSAGFWPQNVLENANKISVREANGLPEIFLTKGIHDLTGELRWSEMPRTLTIPPKSGLVTLTLNGKSLAMPELSGGNQLWLSASEKHSATTHQDTFDVRVFRKIEDTIPLRITTQLQLNVSGKERELQLGQFLLSGFVPVEFNSDLPARLEKDGNLRIQVKPGSWEVTLVSQSATPVNDITYKATSDLWPQQEIWVFAAERKLRSVQISGAQSVDPQQTQLPEDWKNLPAYLVTPETHFKTEELQRGESTDHNNELKLQRNLWLSFDGKRFIFNDTITGNTHSSRLETLNPLELTSAQINNEPQLITQLEGSKNAGIEIRNRDLELTAVSQLAKSFSVPVSGWDEEFNSVSSELHLPPGWSMLTATGANNEYGTWMSYWRLWDIFTLLIIVIAIARVTQPIYGLLAAATLVLIYQRLGAPIFIWLNLIAAIALAKFVTGKFQHFIQRYIYVSFLILVLITLPFVVREARIFVNPQLENEYFWDWSSSVFFNAYREKSVTYLGSPSDFTPPPTLDFVPDTPAASTAIESAPAPAPLESEENDDVVVTGVRSEKVDAITSEDIGKFPDRSIAEPLQRIAGVDIKRNYDPGQLTQTGVAVPAFNGKRVTLTWDGPVKADEQTRLFLVSPWLNRIGHLLAMLFPLLLTAALMKYTAQLFNMKIPMPIFSKKIHTGILPLLIIASLVSAPEPAKAEVSINSALLKELENRLTETPKCLPNCASLESVNVKINQDQLALEIIVHSSDFISLPLPVDTSQWSPSQVTVDEKNASLVRANSQTLLVSLPKGRHALVIKATLQGQDTVNLNFPLQLHNVQAAANGWEISGLPTQEQVSQSLQLQRVTPDASSDKAERLRPDPIAPFVIVTRQIAFDLEWTMTTQVKRVAPDFGAINLEIPALEGESPLSIQRNANGKIPVHLEPNQHEFKWNSTLKQVTPLQLEAAKNVPWVEIWSLQVAPIWHTDVKGIAPVQMDKHESQPVWQPWPGESLTITATKPKATQGNYVTVDAADLNYQPGNRSSISRLILHIRTNQGGQYGFKLPDNSQLTRVRIDRNEQMISASNGQIKLPLSPKTQEVEINWKAEDGVGLLTKTPAFSLEQGSSNQSLHIELPANRWPLFVGGPLVGPSILLWGMLLVVSVVAYALGRSGLTPLRPYEWILLGLGICTLNFNCFVLVALWLIALHKRGQLTTITTSLRFKLLQLALFALSLITLGTLLASLPDGLLGSPDMHILGNQSRGNLFHWYQDHSNEAFPQAWVISLPLWCYKLVMLLWSLWLAASLLRWIRWAWQQLSYQALWYAPAAIVLNPKKEKAVKGANDTSTTVAEPPHTPPSTGL